MNDCHSLNSRVIPTCTQMKQRSKWRAHVFRDEAGERARLAEYADFVHLRDARVEHLALERSKHDRLVLDRVGHQAAARLNQTSANRVDCSDCYDEPVSAHIASYTTMIYFIFI